MEGRAAQFAPFAALTGHDDAIRETARYTSARIELSDDEAQRLNARMEYALSLDTPAEVTITHFVADAMKQGGQYVRTTGRIKKIDTFRSALILQNGTAITLADILDIGGNLFDSFE